MGIKLEDTTGEQPLVSGGDVIARSNDQPVKYSEERLNLTRLNAFGGIFS